MGYKSLRTSCLMVVVALQFSNTETRAEHFPTIRYSRAEVVAPGVTLRRGVSAEPLWQIRILEVDLSRSGIELEPLIRDAAVAPLEKTSDLAKRAGALAAVNAGYFGKPGFSVSHVRRDGVTIAENAASRAPRGTLGFRHDARNPILLNRLDASGKPTTPPDSRWSSALDSIAAGPILLNRGRIEVTTATEQFDDASGVHPDGRHPRTAIGVRSREQKVLLVTVDGRQTTWSVGMTCTEVAQLLQDLNCDMGLNYDGGGSTTCWVDGKLINRPSDKGSQERPVWSAWGVMRRTTVDDLDDEARLVGPAWKAELTTGSYNGRHLVRQTDAPASIVRWVPNLPKLGKYRVDVCWATAPDRATNATYTVTYRMGRTRVVCDQTTTGEALVADGILGHPARHPYHAKAPGSAWVTLGTFPFSPGTKGNVSLSSSGANGSVSADAVRFTLVEE